MRPFTVLAAAAALAVTLPIASPASAAPPPGVITEVPIGSGDSQGIAVDGEGNAWTVKLGTGKIVRVTPGGVVTEFSPPTANSGPRDITIGPDGNLWFTQGTPNQIGRITPSGAITEFPLSTTGSASFITAGADGNLWYTAANNNSINRLSTSGQVTGSFAIPTFSASPAGIIAGPDGNVWFTEFFGNKVGRVTPSGVVEDFPIAASSGPRGIAAGPDGNVWFAATSGNRVGRITPDGSSLAEFSVPGSGPNDITAGPDGNLWFTESTGNKIGRITPNGVITEYLLPNANSSPRQITSDRDGSLRFIENFGNRIGKITSGVSPDDRRPALNGTGQAGLPLVCGADVWGVASTVTVAWQRNGQAIAGQTGLTFTPSGADIGASITCSSSGLLPGMVTALTATSNPSTVVAQLTGPSGPPGPGGTLSAVLAPGAKTVKAGKTLKVQYGVTNAAPLTAQLKGKKTVTKQVQAKAGTNTLKWKLPKTVKPGKYTLRLLFQGTSKASTKVKVTR